MRAWRKRPAAHPHGLDHHRQPRKVGLQQRLADGDAVAARQRHRALGVAARGAHKEVRAVLGRADVRRVRRVEAREGRARRHALVTLRVLHRDPAAAGHVPEGLAELRYRGRRREDDVHEPRAGCMARGVSVWQRRAEDAAAFML